jgi:hypothetical protein
MALEHRAHADEEGLGAGFGPARRGDERFAEARAKRGHRDELVVRIRTDPAIVHERCPAANGFAAPAILIQSISYFYPY